MTPEGKIKDEVKKILKEAGDSCWYYMPVPMGYGRRGIPDIIGNYKGYFFVIETKTNIEEPKPWQIKEMEAVRQSQGKVFSFRKREYTLDHFRTDWQIWLASLG